MPPDSKRNYAQEPTLTRRCRLLLPETRFRAKHYLLGDYPLKMDELPQDDLTNLNWVAGISVPMNSSVSPPNNHLLSLSKSSSSSRKDLTDSTNKPKKDIRRSSLQNGRSVGINIDEYGNKKPNCSFACLIAMALRAAANSNIGGCLPVYEIYRCIE